MFNSGQSAHNSSLKPAQKEKWSVKNHLTIAIGQFAMNINKNEPAIGLPNSPNAIRAKMKNNIQIRPIPIKSSNTFNNLQ